ncbi:MAG: TRAP transporter large permease [Candidatus Eiseniibacteriota bacterium]
MRIPVAVALGMVGVAGYAAVDSWKQALITLGSTPFDLASGYSLSVVPLFIFMGVIASHSDMSRELFAAANAFFSGRRGALAMATVGACAGFGAICGSSLATAATITKVAVPEMRRYGYDEALATGSVASSGTLGILIPPSVILVIYALIAEESVPQLFAAALIPGILLAALHVLVIWIITRINPDWAPVTPAMKWRERFAALAGMWKLALLFMLAVGGIYLGWFSPTEAAAVGAFGALVVAVATRKLSFAQFIDSVLETVWTTAMLFFIVVGAFIFARFMVLTQLPQALVEWVAQFGLSTLAVLLLMIVFYLVLGCFLDSISMILITVPVFLPLITGMHLSSVWFGVLLVVVVEVGLVTPPVGLNLFVIRAQVPDIPLGTVIRGIVPFLGADAALIALLLAMPSLALWLPSVLYK